jgi:hypothetical protein
MQRASEGGRKWISCRTVVQERVSRSKKPLARVPCRGYTPHYRTCAPNRQNIRQAVLSVRVGTSESKLIGWSDKDLLVHVHIRTRGAVIECNIQLPVV